MERQVRWGILGNAMIAREYMIPAMRGSKRSRAAAIASRGPLPADFLPELRRYPDYEALLRDPEIEAVYVPVPNALHAEWSVRAMERGKHVLCEKPMACTEAEGRRMADAARANGVLLMEAFMYRYGGKFRAMREILRGGELGRIRGVRACHGYLLDWKSPARQDPALGGGCLYDVGCYCVDAVNEIARLQGARLCEARSVMRLEGGVDVHSSACLLCGDGMTASLDCWFDGKERQELVLLGERGTLRVPNLFEPGPGRLELTGPDGPRTIETADEADPYGLEADAFSAAILGMESELVPLSGTMENLRTLDLLLRERP